MKNPILIWILRLTAAVILLQTLYFKFTGAPESVYIFRRLGAEPYGRIGSGVLELIASTLILIPKTTWIGAFIGLGTMTGAIFSHLFMLGIEVQNDGGTLFILAVVTWLCCALLLLANKNNIREWLRFKFNF